MRSPIVAEAFCGGVILAATTAWVVAAHYDRFDDATFSNLVGGSGAAACVCALLASFRRSWARLPLLVCVGIAGFMAYARFNSAAEGIDLTWLFVPPWLFALGVIALLMTAISASPEEESAG